MYDYNASIIKEKPIIINILYIIGLFNILVGVSFGYLNVIEYGVTVGIAIIISGITFGSLLIGLSRIIEYLYMLTKKAYLDEEKGSTTKVAS